MIILFTKVIIAHW